MAIGIAIVSNSSNYLILYMPTYAVTQLRLPAISGFIATLVGGIILTVGSPVIGHPSDLVGRTRIMLAAAALFLISAHPTFGDAVCSATDIDRDGVLAQPRKDDLQRGIAIAHGRTVSHANA